ncbi:hypothetical protein AB0J43_36660 [Nonomuraea fuscirosea]
MIPGEVKVGDLIGYLLNPRHSRRAVQVEVTKIEPAQHGLPWLTVALTSHSLNPIGRGYKVGAEFCTVNDRGSELVPWREPHEVALPRYDVAAKGRIGVTVPADHPYTSLADHTLTLENVPRSRLTAVCEVLNEVVRAGFESYAEAYHHRTYTFSQSAGEVAWRFTRDVDPDWPAPTVLLDGLRPKYTARLIAEECTRAFDLGAVS